MGRDLAVEKTVLFDGTCNLCQGAVQFILRRDKRQIFRFASLQSDFAKQALTRLPLTSIPDSIILLEGDNFHFRSDAVLEIVRHLRGIWPVLYVFRLIPRFVRDPLYDWVARHRYRWFGRSETCWLPTPELNKRFL